jgi:hypothetical protein
MRGIISFFILKRDTQEAIIYLHSSWLLIIGFFLPLQVHAAGDSWFVKGQKLIGTGIEDHNNYGNAVAMSGDTIVISSSSQDPPSEHNIPSVYVFIRDVQGNWRQQSKLEPEPGESSRSFGASVSISGDTIAVSTMNASRIPHQRPTGSVRIYIRSGNDWHLQAQLMGSDAEPGDYFGNAVAISGDTLVVGMRFEDRGIGAAYVFTRDETGKWSEQIKLRGNDTGTGDWFGQSVSVFGDTLVIGADRKNKNSGAVYIFKQEENGAWRQQAKLTGSGATGEPRESFGEAVSISDDTLVVGGRNTVGETSSGVAYVFQRNGDNSWHQQARLTAENPNQFDFFGGSVALSGDHIAIGASGHRKKGTVFVYHREGADWKLQARLFAPTVGGGEFGQAIAISDGNIVAGAPLDNEYGKSVGSAHVFRLEPLAPSARPIIIDGNRYDWSQSESFYDPKDDGGAVNWEMIRLNSQHDKLSFLYKNVLNINESTLYYWNLYLDTDRNSATGYGFTLLGADFLLQGKSLYQYTGSGSDWSWKYLQEVEYSVSGKWAEGAIEKSLLGWAGDAPASYRALFHGIHPTDFHPDHILIDMEAEQGSVIDEEITVPSG